MGILGLVGKRRHRAELLALQEEADRKLRSMETHSAILARSNLSKDKAFDAQGEALLLAQHNCNVAQEDCKVAQERCKVAETETARIAACHVGRVRIFVMPIDALEMTARARAVEGSVRIQWSADEKALVGDAGGPLTDAQYQGVLAAIAPQFDRT